MALKAEIYVRKRIIAFGLEKRHRKKLAFGLTHLARFIVQVLNVEPISAPFMTEICLALCYFVCVMRENIINAAAVNIKIFSEIFHTYATAFYVPSGISHSPRAVPF